MRTCSSTLHEKMVKLSIPSIFSFNLFLFGLVGLEGGDEIYDTKKDK